MEATRWCWRYTVRCAAAVRYRPSQRAERIGDAVLSFFGKGYEPVCRVSDKRGPRFTAHDRQAVDIPAIGWPKRVDGIHSLPHSRVEESRFGWLQNERRGFSRALKRCHPRACPNTLQVRVAFHSAGRRVTGLGDSGTCIRQQERAQNGGLYPAHGSPRGLLKLMGLIASSPYRAISRARHTAAYIVFP